MDTRVKPAYDDCNCRWRVHHICCRHTIRRFVHPGLHSSNGDLFAAATSRSRGAMRPSFASIAALDKNKRAQGKPGARCTRGLACNRAQKTHTSIQVQRRQSGLPCAMVYGLLRALPGDRAFLPPSSLRNLFLKNLTPASGCQDHTASPSARVTLVSRNFRVHRIPPRVRDDREPPLSSGETGGAKALICPTG
jgi:hypothetical protein